MHGGVYPEKILSENGQVTGVHMADGKVIAADMVIVSIGVRPRDELARTHNETQTDGGAHFSLGPRGGIVIDGSCATEVEHVWAIGEVANFGGLCVGLVARPTRWRRSPLTG